MTGLELVALGVGSLLGMALGLRLWRHGPESGKEGARPESGPAVEWRQLRESDRILSVFERLALKGVVDASMLSRARLFHDVATRAEDFDERAAAGHELQAMLHQEESQVETMCHIWANNDDRSLE